MSVVVNIPEGIEQIVQDRTLERRFHEALFPRTLFRLEAVPDLWQANVGDTQVFTRTGLLPVNPSPLAPGADPVPEGYPTEQWIAEACRLAGSIDTSMLTSHVALASKFLEDAKKIGMQAGETMNRYARNKLYKAYLGGETVADVAASIGDVTVHVASIAGFAEILSQGRILAVSGANPLAVSFTGGEPDNQVIAAVPDSTTNPCGPGTLTLSAVLTSGVALRDGVRAVNASNIRRVGGGSTVDAITAANVLTLQDINESVATLRSNNVPPCADGRYHLHLSPSAETQLYADEQFRQLFQSLPDSRTYRDLTIGSISDTNFYRNTEVPNQNNVGALVDTSGGGGQAMAGTEVNADVINQSGVPIQRTMMVGGAVMHEKYIDESKLVTDAGVTGKIGQFDVSNGGVSIMTERIRYVLRAPLNRTQDVVSQTWTWSGDMPVTSDQTTGDASRYKRAVVIEHA